MPDVNDSDGVLLMSASILCTASDLAAVTAATGKLTKAGAASVAVRDPELRTRVTFRLLPAIPAAEQTIVEQQIARMASSALINGAAEKIIRRVISILRTVIPKPENYMYGAGVAGDLYDISATAGSGVSEGDVYVLLAVSAQEGDLAMALRDVPETAYISGVNCSVPYKVGYFRHWDSWTLGTIEDGKCDTAKLRLDEMADRNKISEFRSASLADWLDMVAEQTKALPRLIKSAP